ncbi:PREDICTED: uncharacterized protein LOC108772478 [Cyphomyrmex costatus]|uniref:uncharacterized protein LOC108772478 n=1 Tax=Cyphomyrmex costatus TaxID=456900 RepID=UPI0008523667|nr:PREDICTED: uncharacterized protein LOC108772478 [Cyphomyrmex costatus]
MRQRWRPDKGLPPATGKRVADRGSPGRPPVPRIDFTPRPHLDVIIKGIRLRALLDTGSEISFINTDARNRLEGAQDRVKSNEKEVQLADAQIITLPGSLELPVSIGTRHLTHAFYIMPTLKSAVLIGMDIWAQLGYAIPAPPPTITTNHLATIATAKGLATRSQNKSRDLKAFLREELPLFELVQGPTALSQHEIPVKPGVRPIKQRYRPRNPAVQAVIDREVQEMLSEDIIEPAVSAWSSPVNSKKEKREKPFLH